MGDPHCSGGSWPSVLTSHARFNPTNTARYLVDFALLYLTGYGRNTTRSAEWTDRVTADFVVEDGIVKGFGLSGIGKMEGFELIFRCQRFIVLLCKAPTGQRSTPVESGLYRI
ncbi:hypothetical protein EDB83DRAFT_806276 [Lactarius deliciosus]|nr:hypothetical protein EDB83DRAFT_806276 [Lactarius deliciosus]